MALEIELKLRIASGHMNQLKRHPLLKTLASGNAATRKLHNVYYDTPKLELHRQEMALRLRRAGKQWLQTLKGGGGVEAGLHSRNEWESPVAGEALDFAALKACGAPLPKGVRKKLQPIFATDFSRNIRLLTFEGAQIELCMDSGEIRAGKKFRAISELELELKSGEPQQLFKLALALLDIVPLEVEHASKAEYGYRLHGGDKPAVSKAKFPRLEPSQSIAAALRNMVAACLLHVQANIPGALQKLDEEYLHQVRVGLRRLRVVLSMAEAYRHDDELQALHEDVAKLCVQLGRSREWDVFVTQTLSPISKRLPRHAGMRELLRASGKIRKQHHAGLDGSLASPDLQRLLLRLGHWMQGGYWQENIIENGADLTIFAAQVLGKRSMKVSQRAGSLAEADTAQLHALRIACKKLRYSAEIFGALFPAAQTKRYVAALSALQDTMGMLNDITVARRLLAEMENEKRRETLALIRGWMEHDYAAHLAALRRAWKKFAGREAFWV